MLLLSLRGSWLEENILPVPGAFPAGNGVVSGRHGGGGAEELSHEASGSATGDVPVAAGHTAEAGAFYRTSGPAGRYSFFRSCHVWILPQTPGGKWL